MQIGSKSNTYLKQIQSRAKMHEYHVAEKDYVQIEEKAQWIIISAIDIICEFAEEIIESEANIQMDWKKYMVKLRFAMRFFDSFSKSELAGGNVEYFELLGSAIYYLGGRNGSIVKNNAIVTTEKTISFAEEKNNTIYLHFVDSENPEVEDFYVPRVITPQELETSKREKRKVFPDLKKSNDVSIALALKLCMNGGTANLCWEFKKK